MSTRTRSPTLTNSGTRTDTPDSSVAGLSPPPEAVSPLTPGSVSGKAAGLTFLIGPYQVGPYAEGAYEVVVPATVFRSMLATAYAGEFAGQPARAGDVTPGTAGGQSARN